MDLDEELALLEIVSAAALCGRHKVTIETMTLAQQRAMKTAMSELDLTPLVAAVNPVITAAEGSGTGWAKAIAANASTIVAEGMNLLAGDLLFELAAVVLDNEANYKNLAALDLKFEAPKRGRHNVYLNCRDMQGYFTEVLTSQQAMFAVKKAVEVSKFATLGKALFDAAIGGMKGATALAQKTTNNGTPQPESVPDGATM